MEMLNQLELPILHGIQDLLHCDFCDFFFANVTKLGNEGIFWIALTVILLFFKKTRKAGVAMGISLIMGLFLCNLGLKPLVQRIRPYNVDPSITLIIPPESEFSFPSGHTVSSIETAVALWLNHKKAGVAAIILALIIAFSRLYLMVHYPTDVLFGILLGVGIAVVANLLAGWLVRKTKMPVA